jgi:hypothetical protein
MRALLAARISAASGRAFAADRGALLEEPAVPPSWR